MKIKFKITRWGRKNTRHTKIQKNMALSQKKYK